MQWLAGPVAGEQPAAAGAGGAGRVLLVVDELEQDAGECFGDRRRWRAQADEDLVAVAEDVVGGEADDAAGGLGVEQHQAGRRPGTCGWSVVGEDPPEQGQTTSLGEAFSAADVQGR
jgi:hypothetical protein